MNVQKNVVADMDEVDEPFVTVQHLEAITKIPVSWWYQAAAAGKLPNYKFGHYRRFKMSEVRAFLASCKHTPAPR